MKVLVTGATGFTGYYVVSALLEHGYDVRCFARASSNRDLLLNTQVEWFTGDLGDVPSLTRALEGMDALINVASLGFGHAPGIVKATQDAQVTRSVFFSSTAIFTSVEAPSKVHRTAGEHAVTSSNLNYTVLRPTMIYGTARDRNMSRLIRYVQRFPVMPIFGSGEYLQQPVHVEDVAMSVVGALRTEKSARKCYNILGKQPLTYREVIQTVANLMGRRLLLVSIPSSPVIAVLKGVERLKVRLPIKAEQVLRLNEHKQFSYVEASQDFGYAPRDFETGIRQEIEMTRSGRALN